MQLNKFDDPQSPSHNLQALLLPCPGDHPGQHQRRDQGGRSDPGRDLQGHRCRLRQRRAEVSLRHNRTGKTFPTVSGRASRPAAHGSDPSRGDQHGRTDPVRPQAQQELRARPCAARRGPRRLSRRGHRSRRRQRRRQVHAGEVLRRHQLHRQRRDRLRGQAGHDLRPACGHGARDRVRLPGPRAGRQPRHHPEHVPGPRAHQPAALLSDGEMEKQARATLASLSVRTVSSVRQLVANLSGGQRQTVAIAKAVLWNSKVVFLDEPTAALGVAQTRQVLDLVRRLADQGRGVVLISHNMNDVMEVADRVVALYLGRVAAEVKKTDTSTTQIVELITAGRSGDIGLAAVDRRPERLRGTTCRATHPRPTSTPARCPSPATAPAPSPWTSRSAPSVRPCRAGSTACAPVTPAPFPSVLGLVILAIIFRQVSPRFTSQYNIGNIPGSGAYIAIIGLGLVFVLLLGEIDLSAGTAGGTCAALAAVAVFNGKLHGSIPGLLWWCLVIGLLVERRSGGLAQGLDCGRGDRGRLGPRGDQPDPAPVPRPGRRGLHRHRDRCPQRLPRREGRHPELRGDAGAVPGLAGRAPVRPQRAADQHLELLAVVPHGQRHPQRRDELGLHDRGGRRLHRLHPGHLAASAAAEPRPRQPQPRAAPRRRPGRGVDRRHGLLRAEPWCRSSVRRGGGSRPRR